MKRIAVLLVLVGLCVGMDCQGNGPAGFTPNCLTTWFSEEFGVGLNPPPSFDGPTTPELAGFPGAFEGAFEWDSPNSSTTFSVFPTGSEILEEVVSAEIRVSTGLLSNTILVNESFLLNSGQDGWLVVSRRDGDFVDALSVKTFVVIGPGRPVWEASGFGFTDEVDVEDLLGVVRSLCVQGVQN